VTTHRTLLLSLRPRFADTILSGAKTVELRRRPINAQPHTPIILYASNPTMAIVGTARLGEVHAHTPAAAWQKHRKSLGLRAHATITWSIWT
jgi:predicted transcriptional regulator